MFVPRLQKAYSACQGLAVLTGTPRLLASSEGTHTSLQRIGRSCCLFFLLPWSI
jgi:hypothetical protein